MDSFFAINSTSGNTFEPYNDGHDFLLKEKSDALSPLEHLDLEEENLSRHSSKIFDDSSVSEDDNLDLIIVSSRSNNQFTQRLDEQIRNLSERERLNRLKDYFSSIKFI